MNVVSTARGVIQKRPGSTVFPPVEELLGEGTVTVKVKVLAANEKGEKGGVYREFIEPGEPLDLAVGQHTELEEKAYGNKYRGEVSAIKPALPAGTKRLVLENISKPNIIGLNLDTSGLEAEEGKWYKEGAPVVGESAEETFTYKAYTTHSELNAEFDTLVSVHISGVNYLIAAGEGKVYSLDESGKATLIGDGFHSVPWTILQAPVSRTVGNQGPIYFLNGKDEPQYWEGPGHELAAWTGVASNPKLTDGVLVFRKKNNTILKSKTAGFLSTDVGLVVVGEDIPVGSQIEAVLSSEEVELSTGESEETEETKENIHFEISRQYYSKTPHVPNGAYGIFFGNRIWVTGIESDPSAVWFSELVSIGEGGAEADPSVWPATNVVRFDSADGYPVTGIGTVGPYILIFKEKKVWAIHDINTGANRKITDNIGCVSNRSIVETDMGTFFLTARDGIFLTNGSRCSEMAYKVRPTILEINQGERAKAAGCYYSNHYYLSFPHGNSIRNNRTLDYDTQLKSWWLHSIPANDWAIYEKNGVLSPFIAPSGLSEAGKRRGVWKTLVPEVFTDEGAPYEGKYEMAAYWFSYWYVGFYYIFRHKVPTPFLRKRLRAVHFDGSGVIQPFVTRNFQHPGTEESGVVSNDPQYELESPIDFFKGEDTFGNTDEAQKFGGENYKGHQMIFGGEASVQEARLYSLGTARAFSVGFGNSNAEPFEVNSFTFMVQFRKS
jgi:hypothetical protein